MEYGMYTEPENVMISFKGHSSHQLLCLYNFVSNRHASLPNKHFVISKITAYLLVVIFSQYPSTHDAMTIAYTTKQYNGLAVTPDGWEGK